MYNNANKRGNLTVRRSSEELPFQYVLSVKLNTVTAWSEGPIEIYFWK